MRTEVAIAGITFPVQIHSLTGKHTFERPSEFNTFIIACEHVACCPWHPCQKCFTVTVWERERRYA